MLSDNPQVTRLIHQALNIWGRKKDRNLLARMNNLNDSIEALNKYMVLHLNYKINSRPPIQERIFTE